MNHNHQIYRDRRAAVLKQMRAQTGGGLALVTFALSTPVTPERILAVVGRAGSGVRMRKEFMLEARVPAGPWPAVRDALRALLESLA